MCTLDQILAITFSSFWTVLGANDGCRHLYYLSPEQISLVTKINWMSQPFAIMALATGKISVAFLILRIIGQSTWRRGFLYFSMITCFIFCALASIFTFVQCSPPKALWTPSIKGKCWKPESQSDFSVFVGSKYSNSNNPSKKRAKTPMKQHHKRSPNIKNYIIGERKISHLIMLNAFTGWLALIDIALALLPITIIKGLQLSTEKKLGLCTLMGLGILYVSISVGRSHESLNSKLNVALQFAPSSKHQSFRC